MLEVVEKEKQADDDRKRADYKETEVYENKVVIKSTKDITLSCSSTNYRYTIDNVNNLFASNNGQG